VRDCLREGRARGAIIVVMAFVFQALRARRTRSDAPCELRCARTDERCQSDPGPGLEDQAYRVWCGRAEFAVRKSAAGRGRRCDAASQVR
jgi:hypothetical protein